MLWRKEHCNYLVVQQTDLSSKDSRIENKSYLLMIKCCKARHFFFIWINGFLPSNIFPLVWKTLFNTSQWWRFYISHLKIDLFHFSFLKEYFLSLPRFMFKGSPLSMPLCHPLTCFLPSQKLAGISRLTFLFFIEIHLFPLAARKSFSTSLPFKKCDYHVPWYFKCFLA